MISVYASVAVAFVLGLVLGFRLLRLLTCRAIVRTRRCPACHTEPVGLPVRIEGSKPDWERPSGPVTPKRTALYGIGDTLRTRDNFVGSVDIIYADYYAARCSNTIPQGWFEMQDRPPSTKDQVFYGLVALDGQGAVLAGEAELDAA